MSKKRVHEIAKELKAYGIELDNKEVVTELAALGYDVKSHSSSLEDDQATAAVQKIVEKRKPKRGPAPVAAKGFVVRRRAAAGPRCRTPAATARARRPPPTSRSRPWRPHARRARPGAGGARRRGPGGSRPRAGRRGAAAEPCTRPWPRPSRPPPPRSPPGRGRARGRRRTFLRAAPASGPPAAPGRARRGSAAAQTISKPPRRRARARARRHAVRPGPLRPRFRPGVAARGPGQGRPGSPCRRAPASRPVRLGALPAGSGWPSGRRPARAPTRRRRPPADPRSLRPTATQAVVISRR